MIRHLRESAASLLRRLETVDGTGSGLDADTVDGYGPNQIINHPGYPTGTTNYFIPYDQTGQTTVAFTTGTTVLVPFHVPPGAPGFNRLSIEVTSGASAGNNAKLAIYANTAGLPGALREEWVVTADSNAVKEVTIATPLTPGWYWFAVAFQATTTIRSSGLPTGNRIIGTSSYPTRPDNRMIHTVAYASAMPDPMGSVTIIAGNWPIFTLRAV